MDNFMSFSLYLYFTLSAVIEDESKRNQMILMKTTTSGATGVN